MTTQLRMKEIMAAVEAYKAGRIGRNACYKLIERHVIAVNKEKIARGEKNLLVCCLA